MFERNILIVDDNVRVESVYIPAYSIEIDSLKQQSEKWNQYKFKFIHITSMEEALNYLSKKNNCVDVLVVDYDFNGEKTFTSGTAFVKYIREHVNRCCQIVFYTMQAIDSIDKNELIDLVNSDVFRMVDKSCLPPEMGKVLFEAATWRNPIVESLEKFFSKYGAMLQSYKYTFGGEDVSFEDIVNHIRMDDYQGRLFVEKLLKKAILLDINIKA